MGGDMNFWQIVMLMAWLAAIAVYVWAIIAVLIDVTRRKDVSGPMTVAWIVFLVIVPIIGVLVYVALRPKLSREERADVDRYNEDVIGNTTAADQIAELARLRSGGSITEDEYLTLKAGVIG
jgi:membrane protein implicated in regulation of membrane protease activity